MLSSGQPPAMYSVALVYPGCFRCCDIDRDPVILTCKFYLNIVKVYPHIKNEVYQSKPSKVRALTDR